MFKARFRPLSEKAAASVRMQQQQQQQPQRPQPRQEDDEAPPIEKERGPQYPVKEPEPKGPPERVR